MRTGWSYMLDIDPWESQSNRTNEHWPETTPQHLCQAIWFVLINSPNATDRVEEQWRVQYTLKMEGDGSSVCWSVSKLLISYEAPLSSSPMECPHP